MIAKFGKKPDVSANDLLCLEREGRLHPQDEVRRRMSARFSGKHQCLIPGV